MSPPPSDTNIDDLEADIDEAVYDLFDLTDDERDDQGRQEPTRSEPADFGGGDSTGVERL